MSNFYHCGKIKFVKIPFVKDTMEIDHLYIAKMSGDYGQDFDNEKVFEIVESGKKYGFGETKSVIKFRPSALTDTKYTEVFTRLVDRRSDCLIFYVGNSGIKMFRDDVFRSLGDYFEISVVSINDLNHDIKIPLYELSGFKSVIDVSEDMRRISEEVVNYMDNLTNLGRKILAPKFMGGCDYVEDIDRSSLIPNHMVSMSLIPKPRTMIVKWPTAEKREMIEETATEATRRNQMEALFGKKNGLDFTEAALNKKLEEKYGRFCCEYNYETVNYFRGKNMAHRFELKDVKFSGDRTIAFWADGTKTIVQMQDDEKKYDPEKAIMACYMKRVFEIQKKYGTKSPKNASMNKLFDKYLAKYEEEKQEIKAQLQTIKQRKAKKAGK